MEGKRLAEGRGGVWENHSAEWPRLPLAGKQTKI